jgi:hypothetical protein
VFAIKATEKDIIPDKRCEKGKMPPSNTIGTRRWVAVSAYKRKKSKDR